MGTQKHRVVAFRNEECILHLAGRVLRREVAALLQAAELYVADKEVAGTAPASSISEANDTLAPYLKNLSDDASYKLTISADSQGGYTVTGTYTKGNITVTIPEMTVTRVSSSTP